MYINEPLLLDLLRTYYADTIIGHTLMSNFGHIEDFASLFRVIQDLLYFKMALFQVLGTCSLCSP